MAATVSRVGSASPAGSAARPGVRVDAVPIWRHLLQVHADLIEELEQALRCRHGLSLSEFDVLVNLSPGERLRHKDLVGRVVLTRSALSRLLDRMCARGLLRRSPVVHDLRGVRVELTGAGCELRRRAARTNGAIVRARFADLDPTDLQALDRLMGLLHRPRPERP